MMSQMPNLHFQMKHFFTRYPEAKDSLWDTMVAVNYGWKKMLKKNVTRTKSGIFSISHQDEDDDASIKYEEFADFFEALLQVTYEGMLPEDVKVSSGKKNRKKNRKKNGKNHLMN